MKSTRSEASLNTVKIICRALEDKKAENLRVLDVGAKSSITDYMIIATGTSEPHLRALRIELEKVLDAAKVHLVGMDTEQKSGWLVVDAFDVMVHLFTTEKRGVFGLENLWKDAVELSVARLLAGEAVEVEKAPAKPRKPKAAAKKPAAKKAVRKPAAKKAAKKPAPKKKKKA